MFLSSIDSGRQALRIHLLRSSALTWLRAHSPFGDIMQSSDKIRLVGAIIIAVAIAVGLLLPRYQLGAVSGGGVWRLDRITGDLQWCWSRLPANDLGEINC